MVYKLTNQTILRRLFIFISGIVWFLSLKVGIYLIYENQELIGGAQSFEISFIKILINNSFLMIGSFFGFIFLSIPSIIMLISNGLVLGLYLGKAKILGIPINQLLFYTLPHFLEYIALWTVTGSSIINTWNLLKKQNKEIQNSIKTILPLVLLEVFIAALIEYYVEIR